MGVLLLAPSRAEASDYLGFAPLYVGIGIAVPTVLFVSVDLYYGNKYSYSPPGWAIPEVITGAAIATASSAMIAKDMGVGWAAGYGPAALMLIHGTASLFLYEPKVMPAVTPTDGGALFSISGKF